MLAGLFKAPTRYAPHVNLPAARARANEVLTNMVQAGFMTEGQVIGARRQPGRRHRARHGDRRSPDYFLDWAFEQVKDAQPSRRPRADRAHHRRPVAAARRPRRRSRRCCASTASAYHVKQAALVAIEPDGAVRAMVGGRDYGESQFNRATDALRQPGSSFKPFVYATAMMNGFTPKSVVRDAPICIGNWCPQNYLRRLFRADHADHRAGQVDQHGPGPARAGGRRATRSSRWPIAMGITTRAPDHPLAAARRVGGDGPRHGRRLCRLRQWRLQGDALCLHPDHLEPGRRPLRPRARRASRRSACSTTTIVAEMNGMLVAGSRVGHRAPGEARRHPDRRQDRHDLGLSRRLVRRLHRQLRRRRLVRQRRLRADPAADRRHRCRRMTWKRFMTFAHTGIELKPIPFVEPEEPAEPKARGGERRQCRSRTTARRSRRRRSRGPPASRSATTERLLAHRRC